MKEGSMGIREGRSDGGLEDGRKDGGEAMRKGKRMVRSKKGRKKEGKEVRNEGRG